jgi:uncharacterized protein YfaS (alpha-2-macroglobulin family)
MRTLVRTLLLAGVATSMLVHQVVVAGATTGIGSQSPNFTVRVSLLSDGADPDRATVGDVVTVAASVKNETDQTRRPVVRVTLEGRGHRLLSLAKPVRLGPQQELDLSYSFEVRRWIPKGVYTLTVSAGNATGTSTASATLEIF